MLRWSVHAEYLSEINLCRKEKEEAGIGRGRSQTKVIAQQNFCQYQGGSQKSIWPSKHSMWHRLLYRSKWGKLSPEVTHLLLESFQKEKRRNPINNYSNKKSHWYILWPGMAQSIVNVLTHLKLTTTLWGRHYLLLSPLDIIETDTERDWASKTRPHSWKLEILRQDSTVWL